MEFKIDAVDQNARATTIKTLHSEIKTPIFMPVGTAAAVKSLDAVDMIEILDAPIILANTYHLSDTIDTIADHAPISGSNDETTINNIKAITSP